MSRWSLVQKGFVIKATNVVCAFQEDADVYPSGDAYVVVYSVADHESFDCAIEVLYELRKQRLLQKSAVILVGNKQDVVKQTIVSKAGKPSNILAYIHTV